MENIPKNHSWPSFSDWIQIPLSIIYPNTSNLSREIFAFCKLDEKVSLRSMHAGAGALKIIKSSVSYRSFWVRGVGDLETNFLYN